MSKAAVVACAEQSPTVRRLLDERQAQGFPPKISDPAAIDRVAAIVRRAKP